MNNDEPRLIRAAYSARTITIYQACTITIYQAYSPEIAGQAVRAGTFVPPFSRDQMTWIKPRRPAASKGDPSRPVRRGCTPLRPTRIGAATAVVR
jgi:hypothetical protein